MRKHAGFLVILVLMAVVLLLVTCRETRPIDTGTAAPAARLPAAHVAPVPAPRSSWWRAGGQGDMHFVVIKDERPSRADYHQAVTHICAGKTHCFVNFWWDEKLTPHGTPFSDAQIAAQVAGYRLNRTTGLTAWSWRCDLFDGVPAAECM